jgi:2-polyprenyl-3-methyl-5-hydroxy-6-metoxy-1,4-benzoquinol methylase
VIDVGCGTGLAAVELARHYPAAAVEGADLDEASIDLARANARAAGVDVRFHVRDASDPGLGGPYDLITLFDSLHHLARPGETLRALRAELAAGGTVLIAERRAEGPFERFVHLVSRDRPDRARDAAVLRAALNLASTRRRGSQR